MQAAAAAAYFKKGCYVRGKTFQALAIYRKIKLLTSAIKKGKLLA